MAESTLSKLKRQLHAERDRNKRLDDRLNDEANARELVYQIELLSILDIFIGRIDEKECAPMAQKFARNEIVNARKSLGAIKSLALQRLSSMHERIEQDAESKIARLSKSVSS